MEAATQSNNDMWFIKELHGYSESISCIKSLQWYKLSMYLPFNAIFTIDLYTFDCELKMSTDAETMTDVNFRDMIQLCMNY